MYLVSLDPTLTVPIPFTFFVAQQAHLWLKENNNL